MSTRTRVRYWLQHLVEMMIAMGVGMAVLAPLWPRLSPAAEALSMAADMTVGMAAWMAIRGHDLRMITEMSAAMVAPFVLMLVPYAFGAVSAGAVMAGGHLLMVVAMLALMGWQRDHYSHAPSWNSVFRRRTVTAS
jgi:hypothetical protein